MDENADLLRRKIIISRRQIIADIILIIVILLISVYVIINIEEFKTLNKDVCRLCELKTGGTCTKLPQ